MIVGSGLRRGQIVTQEERVPFAMKPTYGFALCLLLMPIPASAEKLNNKAIVQLHASGLDDETIIAKIQSSEGNFDCSTNELILLKKSGVPSRVITAMIESQNRGAAVGTPTTANRPNNLRAPIANIGNAARPAGIYILIGGQLTRIEYNISGQTKTTGMIGSMLSYGIGKVSVKAVLQGDSAQIKTHDPIPTFYFYLPAAITRAGSSSFSSTNAEPSSPKDFSLMRLLKKKASREARLGTGNIAGSQSGVVNKDRVDVTSDESRPGVFIVRPVSPLEIGEYSFVMIGSGDANAAKFFDFSVQ